MTMIDLLTIEYANTPADPTLPFDRVTRALCSLLDKRRVVPPGVSGLPADHAAGKRPIKPFHDPEELEVPDLAELGIVP